MTSDPHTAEERRAPALHCCQGVAPPDGVVEGWAHLLAMPTSAQQDFVELLTRTVVEPDEGALEAMLGHFCGAHGVEHGGVVGALKACQFLLQRSAALDLDVQHFMDDLQKLSGHDPAGLRLVASRYLPLKQRLREQMLERSLADHGKVLVGLDWRVDQVASSDRAVNLDAPVVFLTLRLRDAERSERVTLQLTPRSVQLLRQFCLRFSEPDAVPAGGA